jgi:hypothetical protein
MSLRLLAILAVAALAFSGCASKPPAGTLKQLDYQPPVSGSIVALYQPFANPNPSGQVPTAGPMTQCSQSSIPPAAQPTTDPVLPQCKGPFSTFEAHAVLPDPSAGGYKVYAVGPGYELEVMSLKASGGKYAGTATAPEDLSAKVQQLQIRMDGVPVAVAPGAAGNQTLMVTPAVAALKVVGTFTGRHLDLQVTGLPANGTYMARLYAKDAASPTGVTPKETFEVREGANAYDAKDMDVGAYAEFHIHVGASAVTLYKAAIEPAAK